MTKKGKKGKKVGPIKVIGSGLEGFVDGVDLSVLFSKFLVSRLRGEGTICLVLLLDFPCGFVSGLQILKGKLPPALKYQAVNVQNRRV